MHLVNILAATALFSVGLANADDDARFASLQAMGTLNGVALQCKYLPQVQRMKAAIVASAPTERAYGLAFDEATNESFLAFIDSNKPCPGPAGFEKQVGQAIADMQAAFKAES